MRAGTYHNGWPGCFLVLDALSKNDAQRGTHGGDNFLTLLRVTVVRYLGVIFTPSELATNQWHRLKHHGEALPEPNAEASPPLSGRPQQLKSRDTSQSFWTVKWAYSHGVSPISKLCLYLSTLAP